MVEFSPKTFLHMVQQSRFIDTLDEFYDETIISADNTPPIQGKKNLRKAIKEFFSSTVLIEIVPEESIIAEVLSVTKWHYVFDHNKSGHFDYRQISVQRWNNNKIIQEHHFYQ
jgi:hypothetical protein